MCRCQSTALHCGSKGKHCKSRKKCPTVAFRGLHRIVYLKTWMTFLHSVLPPIIPGWPPRVTSHCASKESDITCCTYWWRILKMLHDLAVQAWTGATLSVKLCSVFQSCVLCSAGLLDMFELLFVLHVEQGGSILLSCVFTHIEMMLNPLQPWRPPTVATFQSFSSVVLLQFVLVTNRLHVHVSQSQNQHHQVHHRGSCHWVRILKLFFVCSDWTNEGAYTGKNNAIWISSCCKLYVQFFWRCLRGQPVYINIKSKCKSFDIRVYT